MKRLCALLLIGTPIAFCWAQSPTPPSVSPPPPPAVKSPPASNPSQPNLGTIPPKAPVPSSPTAPAPPAKPAAGPALPKSTNAPAPNASNKPNNTTPPTVGNKVANPPTTVVKPNTQQPLSQAKTGKKTVAEYQANAEVKDGLFRLLRDKEKGSVYLYIKKKQLGREFIYFTHTVNGVSGSGHNQGRYGDSQVFVIHQHYERLEFIAKNTSYYFDPEHPLARAASANVSNAVLASESIVAQDDEGFLINASGLFLKEALLQVKPTPKDDKRSLLGKLSETKTKFTDLRNYKRNTVLVVEYIYDNATPSYSSEDSERSLSDLADRRYVSVTVQHTLLAMPKKDYEPRVDDPRIGYFSTQVTDQISTEATPWRDFIHRWDLRKKDPDAALSEPVKPIVWWMENTTPLEFRDTIREAVLRWNQSFEKAGFKNAIVVKQQPDDAKWDAGDIDYNVLRWNSSPKPPYGGYGPSFVNPRTGQILGSDIMLEFVFIKNRVFAKRLWGEVGLAGLAEADSECCTSGQECLASHFTQHGVMLGSQMLRLRKADDVEMDRLIKQALTQLILHEVGHTLGLNHNFRASHLHTVDQLQDPSLAGKSALTGSVMDYMPMNLGPNKEKQGEFYITNPGPYDDWAITYGYSPRATNPADEAARLTGIASRSHEPQLAFANDADDMRSPGKAIDPRAMVGDMSSDPIAYAAQRIQMVQSATRQLLDVYPKANTSWQEVTNAYITLTSESSNALTVASRYIGGVYVERAFVGQVKENPPLPLRPVERDKQKAAMQLLAQQAFGPDAWQSSDVLLSHLQQQRRGFDFFKEAEDPRPHERILKIQRSLLDHLLHSSTQNRILDSALYGNTYPLQEVMSDLSAAIMESDPVDQPIRTIRQNLQLEYTDRLINMVKNGNQLPAAKSVALYELLNLRQKISVLEAAIPQADKPHFAHLRYKIEQALDAKAK